jgi:Flp pilus assembly protein TadG
MTACGFRHARRAVAAVEFALASPMLLMFLGGLVDFGFALADQSRMAGAVAQGAQYAYLNPAAATSSTIQTMVTAGASLPGMTVAVTGPGYYCVTAGTPPVLTAATVSTTCLDGTSAGLYVTIAATYRYPALMPASHLVGTTLTEALTARIL